MYSKRIFVILLALCMFLACTGYTAAAQFSDINGHWAQEQINEWAEKGLTGGYQDGTFKPNNEISRAEFVAMVNRAFAIANNDQANTGFADIKHGKWYYEDVITAKVAGYIGGYADGTFKPDQTITRQEVAGIIIRLLQITPATGGLEFSDAGQIPQWARDSVGAVAGAGLMRGMPDNTFAPTKSITRAEAVVSLDRALAYANGESVTVEETGPVPASAVEGVVTNDGKASSQAVIRIFAAGSYEVPLEVETSPQGYFKAELDAGNYDITATTENSVAYKSNVNIAENNVAEVKLELEDAAVVNGLLKDKNDRPVKNTTVLFTTNPTFITTTNNNGEYTIAVMANRSYSVRTYNPGQKDKEPVVIAEEQQVGSAGVQNIKTIKTAFSVASSSGGSSGGNTTSNITIEFISNISIINESTNQKNIITNPADVTISAVSSNEQVTGLVVSGKVITITAKKAGSATITVTAEKQGYSNATRQFTVTVLEKEQPIPLDNPVAITEEVKKLEFANNVSLDFTGVTVPAEATVTVAELIDGDYEVPPVQEGVVFKTAGKVVKIELQGNMDLSNGVDLVLPYEGDDPTTVAIFYYDNGEWKNVDSQVDAVNKVVKATVYHFSTWAPFEASQVATPSASPASGTIEKGATVELTTTTEEAAIYYTTDGTTPAINSSKYTGPVTINNSIIIKAIAVKGNMRNSEEATFDYTVSGNPVTGIVISLIKMDLEVGKTLKLDATVEPENAANKNVTWSSTDENVATVSDTGLVTGVAVGTATVTATTADGGFTATCAVTVSPASSSTPAELQIIYCNEQEIWVSVLNSASQELILGLKKENFSLTDATGNMVDFKFNDPEVRDPDIPDHEYLLSPVEGEFSGTYTLAFTKAGYQSSSEVISIGGPFTPGDGGTLPSFTPFTSQQGKIGGLYVDRSYKWVNTFSGNKSYYPVVDLKFPEPLQNDAESYTLQYSSDGTSWFNYQYYSEDVTTDSTIQDNFSLSSPGGDYQYRLLVNGGSKDGYTSNAVNAPLSYVNTYFSEWGLDESMFLSGTMAPWVGRGLEAYFTVTNLENSSVVDDVYLSYQWYRINPSTYDMIAIDGATSLTYTTTDADAGYRLLIRATGDGENIGGFAQIISQGDNVLPNKAFASDITDSGFTLNLYQSVDSLTGDDLILWDYNGKPVAITSVTPVGNSKAIFAVEANIPEADGPFRLENKSDFWRLAEELHQEHMVHECLTIGSISN